MPGYLLTDTLAGAPAATGHHRDAAVEPPHGPRLVAAGLIGTTLTASTILMLTTLVTVMKVLFFGT